MSSPVRQLDETTIANISKDVRTVRDILDLRRWSNSPPQLVMTAGSLIARLQKVPEDAVIMVPGMNGGWNPATVGDIRKVSYSVYGAQWVLPRKDSAPDEGFIGVEIRSAS